MAFIIIINIIIIVEIKRFIYFILDANPSLPVHHREPSNHLQLPVKNRFSFVVTHAVNTIGRRKKVYCQFPPFLNTNQRNLLRFEGMFSIHYNSYVFEDYFNSKCCSTVFVLLCSKAHVYSSFKACCSASTKAAFCLNFLKLNFHI